MAIASHTITEGSVSGTRTRYYVTWTATNGDEIKAEYLLTTGTDVDALALSRYPQIQSQFEGQEYGEAINKIDNRENPDKAPTDHLAQVDFDRKVLGYMMTVEDPHKLNACLPFWQAVQPRNGNNRAQRIANLGVPDTEYDEIADRMIAYFGAATFLSDDLAAIWPQVKEAWE